MTPRTISEDGIGPTPRYVWVPCDLRNGLELVTVTDAHGRVLQVTAGPMCILGPSLGIRAVWVREENGLHRVRFGDGQRAWVRITRKYQWDDAA
jgi:hypothetical protein